MAQARQGIGTAIIASAALAAAAPPAVAATEPPPATCEAPPAFAAWARPASLVAAVRAERDIARMTMGQAAAVTLSPMQAVRPVVAPGRAGSPLSYAGLLRLRVPVAGAYRFALSGPAWLDVVEAGRSVPSTGHGHGEPCGPIRKLVDLPLAAGDHLVQIAAAPTPNLTIMAIRVLP